MSEINPCATPATPSLDAAEARIHFTETWEDPRVDSRALRLRAWDRVVSVTAGGCTPLSLMTEVPLMLTSVDYNPLQTYLLELKIALLRRLPAEQVDGLLRAGGTDLEWYRDARADLSAPGQVFWDSRFAWLQSGIARSGVATQIFYAVGKFLRRVFKRDVLEGLFECEDLETQKAYYEEFIEHPRVRGFSRWIGPWISRPWALRAVLPADYFPHATERNIPSFLWDRIDHALTSIPVGDNYFLARVLLDRDLSTGDGGPPYLRRAGQELLLDNLTRFEAVTSPLEFHLAKLESSSVDKFQLSNVFEWMPDSLVAPVFEEIVRVGRPGARLLFRNLFTERDVPLRLRELIHVDEEASLRSMESDRSFIYSRCCVAKLCK